MYHTILYSRNKTDVSKTWFISFTQHRMLPALYLLLLWSCPVSESPSSLISTNSSKSFRKHVLFLFPVCMTHEVFFSDIKIRIERLVPISWPGAWNSNLEICDRGTLSVVTVFVTLTGKLFFQALLMFVATSVPSCKYNYVKSLVTKILCCTANFERSSSGSGSYEAPEMRKQYFWNVTSVEPFVSWGERKYYFQNRVWMCL